MDYIIDLWDYYAPVWGAHCNSSTSPPKKEKNKLQKNSARAKRAAEKTCSVDIEVAGTLR